METWRLARDWLSYALLVAGLALGSATIALVQGQWVVALLRALVAVPFVVWAARSRLVIDDLGFRIVGFPAAAGRWSDVERVYGHSDLLNPWGQMSGPESLVVAGRPVRPRIRRFSRAAQQRFWERLKTARPDLKLPRTVRMAP